MTNTVRRAVVLVLAAIVGVSLVAAFLIDGSTSHESPSQEVVSPSWVADFTDRANIVKYFDNIYVATVTSSEPANDFFLDGPGTKYTVEIVESLKGDLHGRVSVMQFGGYADDETVVLVEGDWLLAPGRQYLMASSESDQPRGQVLLSTFGHTDLSALSSADAAREVQLMRAAVAA